MADKKISQLDERVTDVLGADILPLVGNTTTTPTNSRVQVKNLLGRLALELPQTSWSGIKLTAAVVANGISATLAAGEFAIVANSTSVYTVQSRYGLIVRNEIQNNTSNVTGQFAAALFKLDLANSNFAAANTFGVVIDHALDTGVAAGRRANPRAYLAIKEGAPAAGRPTLYLFDIGAQGNVVSANTSADANVVFSRTVDKVVNRTLKINVNGEDIWILASNVAPA